jgi:hypothetical protein
VSSISIYLFESWPISQARSSISFSCAARTNGLCVAYRPLSTYTRSGWVRSNSCSAARYSATAVKRHLSTSSRCLLIFGFGFFRAEITDEAASIPWFTPSISKPFSSDMLLKFGTSMSPSYLRAFNTCFFTSFISSILNPDFSFDLQSMHVDISWCGFTGHVFIPLLHVNRFTLSFRSRCLIHISKATL